MVEVNAVKLMGQRPRATKSRFAVLTLCLLLPGLLGGCPGFRNDVVGIFEAATRSIFLDDAEPPDVSEAVVSSFIDATISLAFDQFRTDEIE